MCLQAVSAPPIGGLHSESTIKINLSPLIRIWLMNFEISGYLFKELITRA